VKSLLAFLLLPAALCAQTYVAKGDNTLTLGQILHLHPEGMILLLPGPKGSLAQGFEALLDHDPALQISSQELEWDQTAGKELKNLKGWNPETAHWALLGPDKRIHAEGTGLPDPARLSEAYRRSPLRTRLETLRVFLTENPGHAEALAQYLLEARALAGRRTEIALGTRHSALSEEQDDEIWSDYAERYARYMDEGMWLQSGTGEDGPFLLAAELAPFADRSPRLRDLAGRLLPGVESRVRQRPGDEGRWKVWASLRVGSGRTRASSVLTGLKPPPGTLRWPPPAALDAYVEDARDSGDWHEVEPLLQASCDQALEFLTTLEKAALTDAAKGGRPGGQVELGTYFGFGNWNEDLALLLEAKIRLGKNAEADQAFQAFYSRVPKAATARQAAAVARTCGAEDLALKWGGIN